MESAQSSLPALYTAAQCRELDRLAIETHGMPGFELMLRAGRAAYRELQRRWPAGYRIGICCGKGNNAGDGYIVAALAREAGLEVTLWQLGDPAQLRGDAARARDWALQRGVVPRPGPPRKISADVDVVVDALLGTGIQGELRPEFAASVAAVNGAAAPVLAIDIPTGIRADTGAVAGAAVRADVTVTFIGRKLGLHTGAGAAHAGTVVFDDLGVPSAIYRAVRGVPWLRYPDLPDRFRLGPRDASAYKHALGHVVVVGGDHSMGGAPLMAAEAALRCGAGMVSVVTRAGHRPAILARRPEVMVVDADDEHERRAVLDRANCLVVGPGLGRHAWGRSLMAEALDRALPTVLDADGINHLADLGQTAHGPLIVTPHAAEAAGLLGSSVAAVQNDRPAAALALARRVQGVAVLKGAGSLIAAHQSGTDAAELVGICAHGNPGMASAGMGDVQSGIIGGLLAQGLEPAAAAAAGTCLHSFAADRAAAVSGQRSLLALDLLQPMVDILVEEEARWDRPPD
jgi:ADP-dependent NAD(P)H-hydrate dehydratase / NAD(P)H-hydrate epimerase